MREKSNHATEAIQGEEQLSMPAKLLNVHQVAELLSISKRTAEYWQASGRLPGFVRLYGNRRWRSDALEEWMAAGFPDLALCRSVQTESHVSTGENISGESAT